MKTAATILAGLLAGILVAAGALAAFVFVGPDPVGLRPTPSPSVAVSPSPSPSASPSLGPSGSPAGSPSPSAGGSGGTGAFHIGQPAPALSVAQLGGGLVDLTNLKGKAVWLNFMQTTCPECIDEFPIMNGFQARYEAAELVVIAIDIREDEDKVTAFATQLNARFPIGLDTDGTAQRAWGAFALPTHFFVDKDGIVRDGVLGGAGSDAFAAGLRKILPGVTVTP
jgi:cytochrome c biogenesis protein CcmG/thiol:disulfide interchange protein DsbE